jgi:hypothetical protein
MRRPKEKRKYFTQETEDAIILYNQLDDIIKKNSVYEKHIHYPFFKLTQNLIHTFKFYHTDVDDLTHLQHELEIFLISKIHLFHHSNSIQNRLKKIIEKKYNEVYYGDFCEYTNNSPKVTQEQINTFISTLWISDECVNDLKKLTPPKAYSYFGTIAKRWLILYNDKNYKSKIQKYDMVELEKDENHSYDMESTIIKDKLSIFIDEYIDFITKNIYAIFPKNNDAQVADAIMEMFRKRENLDMDIFNKKVLYLYVREQIEVKTPKITKIINILKSLFTKNYTFYLENDFIDFKSNSVEYV